MLIENSNGPPDVSLELCSCRVDHIPEVDLVGQLGEGSQERLNGGIGTGRGKILKSLNRRFCIPGKTGLTGTVRETTPEKMSGRARPASQQIVLPQSCLERSDVSTS